MMLAVSPFSNRSVAKAEGRFELSRFEPRLKAVLSEVNYYFGFF